jgi:hypothetical protein
VSPNRTADFSANQTANWTTHYRTFQPAIAASDGTANDATFFSSDDAAHKSTFPSADKAPIESTQHPTHFSAQRRSVLFSQLPAFAAAYSSTYRQALWSTVHAAYNFANWSALSKPQRSTD